MNLSSLLNLSPLLNRVTLCYSLEINEMFVERNRSLVLHASFFVKIHVLIFERRVNLFLISVNLFKYSIIFYLFGETLSLSSKKILSSSKINVGITCLQLRY